jgi:fructose-bisphosphate aldolase, class I
MEQSAIADMLQTAEAVLAPAKGILAADESLPTIGKRFEPLGIPSTPETHRAYRELLFGTPDIGAYISGAILFDETIRQNDSRGAPLADLLAKQGIVVGIKVDQGTLPFAGFPGEKISEGLDGLRLRLAEYRKLGARFAKWRVVIGIDDGVPTRTCIADNARTLAQYAALCQEAGIVPIVEPEVLMDGKHSLARCEDVTSETLRAVMSALAEHRVLLEATILKTGMVVPGEDCTDKASAEQIAEATLRCLRRTVPSALPGVVFLSGGQSEVLATEHLNEICKASAAPWKLTFSFGRALQDSALKTWRGSADKVGAARQAFRHRAERNALAVQGKYRGE